MILVVFDALESILKVGQKLGKDYVSFVDECDGITMIETLQEHENNDVYEKAIEIIETYFGLDDGAEDENIAPAIDGNTFAFGVPRKNLGASFEEECPVNGFAQPMATFNFAS